MIIKYIISKLTTKQLTIKNIIIFPNYYFIFTIQNVYNLYFYPIVSF